MKQPGFPANESERLAWLHELALLETPSEEAFDRITRLAATLFKVPVCLISLVDAHQQWIKSRQGIELDSIPRATSFCGHVVASEQALVVPDATLDERFADNPLVTASPFIRFYAGVPLRDTRQFSIGTLCLIDHVPRQIDQDTLAQLQALASMVMDAIHLRQRTAELLATYNLFSDGPIAILSFQAHKDWHVLYASSNTEPLLGLAVGRTRAPDFRLEEVIHPEDLPSLHNCLASLYNGLYTSRELNIRLMPHNTVVHHFFMGLNAVYGSDGSIRLIQAYLFDISRQKQLEASLESARQRLTLALEAANLGTWDINLQTRQGVLDQRAAIILGLSVDEGTSSYDTWEDRIHPADHQGRKKALEAHLAGVSPGFSYVFRLRHLDGHYVWIESHGRVVSRDSQGAPLRIVGTHQDISQKKWEEENRDRQQRLLALLSESQQHFLLARDTQSALQDLLEPLMSITDARFGLIGEVVIHEDKTSTLEIPALSNKPFSSGTSRLFAPHTQAYNGKLSIAAFENAAMRRVLKRGSTLISNEAQTLGLEMLAPEVIPSLNSFIALPCLYNNVVLGVIGLGNRPGGFDQDIVQLLQPLAQALGLLMHAREVETARQKAEVELHRLATTDALTGIPNRRVFLEHCAEAMEMHGRYGGVFTLGLIDIDHFKTINDVYGHQVGDQALKAVTQTVAAGLRSTDHFGRVGGEEFGILLPNTNEHDAVMLCDRLRHAVETMQASHDHLSFQICVSIGLAQIDASCKNIEELMGHADQALYKAKNSGRNCVFSHKGITRQDIIKNCAPELHEAPPPEHPSV
ncbi:sensor domain-containing diguanylate cyclase [Uliginosibacterium gangwonense]|uniref:sensor domain-containing diguanylate cyclase n=1 Tax=Uliginosibacterium gangwonense TaxID=392736 RepID=UPI00036D0133|nr:diguanylate cyclase [Uliginosibacterium gangwonense]